MLQDSPKTIYLKDYLPPEYLIDRVDLHFVLDEAETRVGSRLHLRRNPASNERPEGLRLHGEQLELISLSIDGRALPAEEYAIDGEGLTIHKVPDQFVLESQVRIHPEQNTALEGLYKVGGLFCTQCEPEGFRKITWFLDRPDVMARFTTTIEGEKGRYPVMLSNGNPVHSEELPDGRHRVRWEDPFPKPAYLFALVAGDLRSIDDRFTTSSGRDVALRIFVEPENIDKCDHAMASLKKAMRWDEEVYGREYDLDIYMIVATNDFNMGAMENKGLNVFNSKYVLARPDTATDVDFQGIESVIAHEYFHNWTGNRITCRDWFQLSLKEGLTVFRDQEFSGDMGSRGVKRIGDVRRLRQTQFAEDAGPMAHPVRPDSYIEINNFYTSTVYEKGAEVIRMQQRLLGAEKFRRATDLYFERHDGQAVTTDDFVRCMEEGGGRDLTQFKRWYVQSGTPVIHVEGEYDPDRRTYTLNIEQRCPPTPGQPDKAPFHIPFAIGLLGPDGRDLPLVLVEEPPPPLWGRDGVGGIQSGISSENERNPGSIPPTPTLPHKGGGSEAGRPDVTITRVLELRDRLERFTFRDIPAQPVPSLLRSFCAPVKIEYPWQESELIFLMAHDSDGFNRWDAAQTLAQQVLLRRVTDPGSQLPEGFLDAFRRVLTDSQADKALLAEILDLPGEGYLGDQMAQVDVDAIHVARDGLIAELSTALHDDLLAVYEANREPGPYDIAPPSIGRRMLRNRVLGYLMAGKSEAARALCVEQYRSGHNMTDQIEALKLLAHSDLPEREELLEEFYTRWQNDPLVLDKWFNAQAVSSRVDTLQRVTALLAHPAFSIRNPNKVRSLVGAFCNSNPVRFHGADGGGYRFLADRVLELDPLNPQVASRMLRAMANWRRYDPAHQALMRAQFERVMAQPGLSRDVYEVASKSLA